MSNKINKTSLAPIALFAFKRPEHTRRTLEALAENPEFEESPLFIYCDGARNNTDALKVEETRYLVRGWPHPKKIVIERDCNFGLANSIITGVTELCESYGKVIVVEDDLFVSSVFLNYLNEGLRYYSDEPRVMQISAYMLPVSIQSPYGAIMLPFTTSLGWATWNRAWKDFDPSMSGYELLKKDRELRYRFNINGSFPYFRMLKNQMAAKIDSWAIRWYLSVFLKDGLVLFPKNTLVRHDGYDQTATHASRCNQSTSKEVRQTLIDGFPSVDLDQAAFVKIATYYHLEYSFFNRLKRRFGFE
jgi:hypothetical protein